MAPIAGLEAPGLAGQFFDILCNSPREQIQLIHPASKADKDDCVLSLSADGC